MQRQKKWTKAFVGALDFAMQYALGDTQDSPDAHRDGEPSAAPTSETDPSSTESDLPVAGAGGGGSARDTAVAAPGVAVAGHDSAIASDAAAAPPALQAESGDAGSDPDSGTAAAEAGLAVRGIGAAHVPVTLSTARVGGGGADDDVDPWSDVVQDLVPKGHRKRMACARNDEEDGKRRIEPFNSAVGQL